MTGRPVPNRFEDELGAPLMPVLPPPSDSENEQTFDCYEKETFRHDCEEFGRRLAIAWSEL